MDMSWKINITLQIIHLIQQRNGLHQKRENMITEILKTNKPEVFEMIQKNSSAKSLLKQCDGIWKRIEMMLQKDLKKILVKK